MSLTVSQEYWEQAYAQKTLAYKPEDVPFRDMFDQYLSPGGTCFEVGCYPGYFLIYLGQRFGFQVSGIDLTPQITNLPDYIRSLGVAVGQFYQEDFLTFNAENTYDVVCSFGFIEHFREFGIIIKKHTQLVKPGGTLVMACPNFRGMQYVFHRLFDPANLHRHELRVMNLRLWKHILSRNGMKIIHQGYYRTADFWSDSPRQGPWARRIAHWLTQLTRHIDQRIDIPNPWFSPFMISFSMKIS
jgi:2-polyprenyl-3-methyl-5-hydroxy-6-metoxy-1,4-benzoquinol methylase